ncbi:MAG: MFS transporter, partial [Methanomassiliicoccales archaeon]|nr:MFS transporter [Methanomassiliicoccales archaeon]
IVLLGLVSLFADMTYEGAKSITGSYLAVLGAGAMAVALIIGFGELIGYTPRLLSGSLIDKTGRYWTLMFVGYGVNLFAVPFLAFTGDWATAAVLIIIERAGKALRAPARDAMLSHAAKEMGGGWAFGLHEALSSVGAMLGPVAVALVIMFNGDYQLGFLILIFPAIVTMIVLTAAWKRYPRPRELEVVEVPQGKRKFPKAFWLYVAAGSLIAAGFADFPFISYHFQKIASVPGVWIPIFYAMANGVDALAALGFGRMYDRRGMTVLIVGTFISAFFAPLVFFDDYYFALAGMALFGLGLGLQESVMRAVIAHMVPANKRGSAYGIFSTAFGIFWFFGTAMMGILYMYSVSATVVFSLGTQLAGVAILIAVRKRMNAAPAVV